MRLLLYVLIFAACTACATNSPSVELGGERFTVDIADEPQEQSLGLMYRDSMADDHGMLFIFPREAPRSFWMKNTRIPLDIMYFDKELKMVSLSANTPPCKISNCPSYPSSGPAMYVLELNAGKASELGVGPGSLLTLHLD